MQIDLEGKDVSSDPVMEKVIEAKAKIKELQREVKALKKDREQLYEEYIDFQKARDIPVCKNTKVSGKAHKARISVGDLHGMRMDSAAVQAFLLDVKTLAPDEIVLGGDMIDCGGWLAKHQPIGFVAETDYSYQEDIQATNWFLDELQAAAPEAVIHYLEGNHENRVERWCVDQTQAHKRDADFLKSAFSPAALLHLADRKIKYYERSEIYGEGLPRGWVKLGKMYFTHELGKSKNAARDAALRTAGNVTYFHTHREDSATVVFPSVGVIKAFCPGCLCQMQPLWKHSEPTNWSQGYSIDFIGEDDTFQRVQVPIWRGKSLAQSMIQRLQS